MDKPRHPIVSQPWKIRQTQQTERNVKIKNGKKALSAHFEGAIHWAKKKGASGNDMPSEDKQSPLVNWLFRE